MSLRGFFKAASGQFEAAMQEATADVKRAAMGAAHRGAEKLKKRAVADIAGAGFGSRWQKATVVTVYPERKASTHPTIRIRHAIPFSNIFETGGTIVGRPLLWIALPTAPRYGVAGKRMTPRLYRQTVGPLFSVNRPGKRPLLATRKRVVAMRGGKRTFATETVPLFVGIKRAELRDRFSIREIAEQVAAELPALFAEEFGD